MRKIVCVYLCLFLVCGLFAFIPAGVVEGQDAFGILYESNVAYGSNSLSAMYEYVGQVITASNTYDVSTISFFFKYSGSIRPSIVTFYVYDVVGSAITSKILEFSSDLSDLTMWSSGNNMWVNLTVSGGVTFIQGSKYWIGWRTISANNVHVTTETSGLNPYTGGAFTYSSVLPPSNLATGDDMGFRVYGVPAGSTVGGYSYTFLGAKFDNNASAASDSVMLNLVTSSGQVFSQVVGAGQNLTVTSIPLVAVSWNFSSVLNLTRSIEFLPFDGTSEGQQVFQLLTADSNSVMGVYLFNVVDYTGSVQWLEVSLGDLLVERRGVGLGGGADFSLYRGLAYTVTVLGDKGSFSQRFIAGTVFSNNFIVLAGSFGEFNDVDVVGRLRFAAFQSDGEGLVVEFDNVGYDGVLRFEIFRREGGLVSVYDSGLLGYVYLPLRFVFGEGEVGEFLVSAVFTDVSSGVVLGSWSVGVSVGVNGGIGNPFVALFAPFFMGVSGLPGVSVLPEGFEWVNLPVAGVVLLVLAIFSWRSHATGCFLSWVVGLIFLALGWWTVSLPAFGCSLVVAIFIGFSEGKQQEREV